MDRRFFYSVSALIGSIVGIGIFGLPFVFAKAGFWVGFVFLIVVGGITLLINLMYGEIVLRTSSQHQMVGYAGKYAGPYFKKITFFAAAFSSYSALLAYIVIAGQFLGDIFFSFKITPSQFSYVFFIIFSILVLMGIKRVSWIEFVLTSLFILVVLLILVTGFNNIDFDNYSGNTPYYWFLPYGVLVFAFAGFAGVPIQREILKGKEHLLKKSIICSMIAVAILYLVFCFSVVGISGESTTPDAIRGLYEFLGGRIAFLGSLFGILAVGTAYLMLGSALKEIFMYDYGMKSFPSWLLVVFPPIVFFWGGVRTFIDIIGLAGALALGLEMIILVFVYIKAKSRGDRVPEYSLNIPKFVIFLLLLIFLSGIVYTFVNKS